MSYEIDIPYNNISDQAEIMGTASRENRIIIYAKTKAQISFAVTDRDLEFTKCW